MAGRAPQPGEGWHFVSCGGNLLWLPSSCLLRLSAPVSSEHIKTQTNKPCHFETPALVTRLLNGMSSGIWSHSPVESCEVNEHIQASRHTHTHYSILVQMFKLIEIWDELKETQWTNIASGYLWPFLHPFVDEWHTVLKLNMVSFKSQINKASISSLWFIHLHHF